jgi:hypothetical protein
MARENDTNAIRTMKCFPRNCIVLQWFGDDDVSWAFHSFYTALTSVISDFIIVEFRGWPRCYSHFRSINFSQSLGGGPLRGIKLRIE